MLKIFYHSNGQIAFTNAEHLNGNKAELTIYNLSGELIYPTTNTRYNGDCTLDLNIQSFPDGKYIVTLQTHKEKLTEKVVKR